MGDKHCDSAELDSIGSVAYSDTAERSRLAVKNRAPDLGSS